MIRKPIFILSIAVGGLFVCAEVGGADSGDAETVGSPARTKSTTRRQLFARRPTRT